jgi:hypothetical protein
MHQLRRWLPDPFVTLLVSTCCLIPAAMFGVAALMTLLHQNSNLVAIREALALRGVDSWMPMGTALAWLRSHPTGDVYGAVFFGGGVKFQYPLTSLPFIDWLPGPLAAHVMLLNALGLGFILLSAILMAAFIVKQADPSQFRAASRRLLAAVGAIATLCFYPLLRAAALGQIQVELTAAFIACCTCYAVGAAGAAGFLAGCATLIKPQLGLLLLWGLLRREWRFGAGFLLACGIGFAVTVLKYGTSWLLPYVRVLSFLGRHGETYAPNQSVNGLFNRLLHNGSSLQFSLDTFPPYQPLVYAATFACAVLLVGFGLLCGLRSPSGGRNVGALIVAGLCFTMASPIAWEHHYGVLLPAFAYCLVGILASATPERRAATPALVLLGVSFVLSANAWPIFDWTAATPANPLQSYLLFAALGVLGLTAWFSARTHPGISAPQAGSVHPRPVLSARASDPTEARYGQTRS